MFREITQIVLAIQLSAGHMTTPRATVFAQAIQEQSVKVDVDPMVEIAIIAHESQWNERAISQDHLDFGLMQVRSTNYGGKPEWLLNGLNNIRVGSYVIAKSKDLCRRFLKREPTTQEWLSCYQGSCYNYAHMCKPTHLTKLFTDYAECLTTAVSGDAETDSAFTCNKIYYPQSK